MSEIDNFDLFEQLLSKYEEKESGSSTNKICEHKNIVYEHNVPICTDCGEEFNRKINHEKEWRYYAKKDGKFVSDPNRVTIRKQDERSIYKDVQNMGISDNIIFNADKIYNKITKGQIYRGKSRKAVIFACVFHAYRNMGNPQTPENLIKQFKISRKLGLKGLKIVSINAPKDINVHSTSITVEYIIKNIMEQFCGTENQVNEAIKIYKNVKNKSSKLNRSRPRSLSSSIVYYWILKNDINISLKEFSKKVELSELTIQKNIKEIENVFSLF